jgi:hypothetical protein
MRYEHWIGQFVCVQDHQFPPLLPVVTKYLIGTGDFCGIIVLGVPETGTASLLVPQVLSHASAHRSLQCRWPTSARSVITISCHFSVFARTCRTQPLSNSEEILLLPLGIVHLNSHYRFVNAVYVCVYCTQTCLCTAWRWRKYVSPKRWYLRTNLHGVTTHKINIHILITLRISDLI